MRADWRAKSATLRGRFGLGGAPKNRETRPRRGVRERFRPLWAWVARAPRPSWRALGVTAAVVLVAALAWQGLRHRQAAFEVVREHPYFRVAHIEINGTGSLVAESELREWLGIRAGDSLWEAAPEQVAARLRAHPMLRSAVVRRVFPGTLDIRVEERQPAAITVLDDLYYLDRNGESFGPLGPEHGRDYPIFTGVAPDADGQRRWALRRALELLEASDLGLDISELHLDPEDGLVLFLSQPRVPMYLGWQAWERRLERAERVLATMSSPTKQPARIDLRFRDQVVVKLREPLQQPLVGRPAAPLST